MGQSYTVAARQDRAYTENVADAGAVADPTADIEITVKAGVTPMELYTGLKQALSFIQERVRTNASAAP